MKVKKSNSGVSEVVGSILILMITITMFAVVMGWVLSYPTPSGRAYVDLNAEVNGQYVNITHCGGEPLEDKDTDIHVYVDGDTTVYEFSDGGIDTYFSVGETWSKKFDGDPVGEPNVTSTSTVEVAIVDTKGGEVIFDETLQGVSGNNKPVVAFACTVPSSVPADGSTPFKVYAYIMDPDKDVNNSAVTVDLSSVGKGTYSMTSTDGIIFKTSSLIIASGTSAGVYKSNIISATDSKDNTATGYVQVTVTTPANLTDIHDYFDWSMEDDEGATGYDIYNETGLITRVGTRVFLQGETIYMQVGSLTLRKIKLENRFVLYDSTFTKQEPQTREYKPLDPDYVEGGPLDEPAFYDIATPNPKYYMYEYNCTAPSTAGQYLVDATMKDTAGNLFMTWDTIYICNPDGSVPNYPKIVTCKDANNDGDLSDLYEETEFKHTEKMYVKVVTKDTNAIENVDMGDVEINDFKGIWHIKKNIMPDATTGNPPVSGVNTTTAPSSLGWDGRAQGSEFYTFSIDLLNPNHAGWLKGTNTYILMVRYFKDGNEEYGKLAMLVKVKGPVSSMDIIVTTEETSYAAWKSDGSAQWFDNGNYWERTFIDPAAMKNAEAMVIGDVDGDGDNDVVVGFREDEPNNIMWYRNTAPDGKEWQRHVVSTTIGGSDYKVLSLALGDLDNDGDMEIIAGLEKAGQNIPGIVFVNDGDWTPVQLPGAGGGVSGVAEPLTQGAQDTTQEPNTTDAKTDDQSYYTVSNYEWLHFDSWDTSAISGIITGVTVDVQYKTDPGYDGSGYIQFNNSNGWLDTTIQPAEQPLDTTGVYDLFAQGVNTFTEIENLGIRFYNNGNKTIINTTLIPTAQGDEDTTGGSVVDIQTDNDAYYIISNAVLHLKNFTDSLSEDETIYNVTLKIQYKTEAGYSGNYFIQYRKGPNDIWNNTTIDITNHPEEILAQYSNFTPYNFTTKAEIDNLEIRFINPNHTAVKIDYMHVIVKHSKSVNVHFDYIWINVTTQPISGVDDKVKSIAVGDIDNDGDLDIITGADGGEIRRYRNKGNGTFYHPELIHDGDAITYNSLALGKMEGNASDDNDLDIVVARQKKVDIFQNKGDGTFEASFSVVTLNKDTTCLAIGDMNDDGKIDIVIGTKGDNNGNLWRLRQSTGSYAGAVYQWDNWQNERIDATDRDTSKDIIDIAVGDTDGDGDLDVVIAVYETGATPSNVWHYANVNDNATAYKETNIYEAASSYWGVRKEKVLCVELAYIDT